VFSFNFLTFYSSTKPPFKNCNRSWLGGLFIGAAVGCTSHSTSSSPSLTIDPTTVSKADDTNSATHIPAAERTIDLSVDVSGFASGEGACRIAVYLGPAGFNNPDFAIAKQVVAIEEKKSMWVASVTLTPEQAATYQGQKLPIAISAYHDSNENSILDKGAFGVPTERYGFSNNPKRGFGPPKFQEVAVSVSEDASDKVEIEIQLQ
jgi:uncharacterized protein (DUF2141 family)